MFIIKQNIDTMIHAEIEEQLATGNMVEFCPDLDRGARFSIENIEPLSNNKVRVSLKYLNGRWSPNNREKLYEVEVPEDFTTEDIECECLGIPNLARFTL